MNDPLAVLIEDDPQQAEVSAGVLSSAGFSVRSYSSIAPALTYMQQAEEMVDLFVLDRRLPVNVGEPATDELGDELLKEVRARFPDARLIVFTGFATIAHVQESLRGGGQLPVQTSNPIDRITVLQKDQSLEFKQQVEEFRALIQDLDNIEVRIAAGGQTVGERDRRVLRRVAFEYRAASITATVLAGGLTGAGVWKCDLRRIQGSIATVVAKRVKKASPPGGLPELLPRASATPTIATLSGLMGGDYVNVLHMAGTAPVALMEVVGSDPVRAVDQAKPILAALSSVPDGQQMLSVSVICRPLIGWDELFEVLGDRGVVIPAGTLVATVNVGMRHGDLHPANILLDDGHAVLIDFDSSEFAAGALDPVTLLISTLVHPDSPLRGSAWPSAQEIDRAFGSRDFGRGHSHEAWFDGVGAWAEERRASEREFWALVMAYAGRQLRYSDVTNDASVTERLLALARKAAACLAAT